MERQAQSKRFADRTGYDFKNTKLLELALTHSSFAVENHQDNERLEFLGDRVLALVIADELSQRYPDSQEGELARRLNSLVRKESCAAVAQKLKLGEEMADTAPKNVRHRDIFDSQNVLGDACEAVLAAIYLDGGLKPARKFVLKFWAQMLEQNKTARRDPKSTLQEWALGQGLVVPKYEVISRQGPDHQPVFEISVEVEGKGNGAGSGSSKRTAEQAAATNLLKKLKIRF